MDALLTYILQVNLLISLIYLAYYFLLKKLTFYNLNRYFFLLGGIYAFVFPLIDFKVFFTTKIEISPAFTTDFLPLDLRESASQFNLQNLFIYILIIGALFFTLKMILQFASLTRIHINSKADQWNQYYFRNVMFSIAPFTFFRTIYLHRNQHHNLALSDIFKHESIHVKGLHTIDVLLFEIIIFFCWYNPFVWLLRGAVSQNLEFLTDQKVLDLGIDKQTYQFSLLKVSSEGSYIGISNQFNFKNLKKRILMMNKERSSKIKLSSYAVVIPILIFFGISFTSFQAEAKIDRVVVSLNETELSFFNNPMMGLKSNTSQFLANMMIQSEKNIKSPVVTAKLDTIITTEIDSAGISNKSINMDMKFDSIKSNVRPLFVIDGEVMPKSFKLGEIDPIEIYSMEVIKGTKAIDRYGEAGRDGAVLLTLKSKVVKENIKVRSSDDPLYVVDGEILSGSEINKVSPDSIKSISVLKGENATALYGDGGRNGVVLITSKNQMNKSKNTKGRENF